MKTNKLDKLKFDDKNFNKHTDEGLSLLEKSIRENKFGRSILIDKDDNIVAGNGVVETARKMGHTKVRVVETDGDELIAIKRKDLSLDSKEGRSLALADNAVAAADLAWNEAEIKAATEEWGITPEEWGVDFDEEQKEIKETEKLSMLKYKGVYYEPKKAPNILLQDCIDETKFKQKVKFIESLDLSKGKKDILKMFAYRFIRIDFERVADYYAYNASEEEKKAIERLRLVLVDDGAQGWIDDDLLKMANVTKSEDD